MQVMVRAVFPASPGMALTARGGHQDVVRWDLAPVRLVKILAGVKRFRVVARMTVDSKAPMVCRPQHLNTCTRCPGCEPARTCKEIHSSHGYCTRARTSRTRMVCCRARRVLPICRPVVRSVYCSRWTGVW